MCSHKYRVQDILGIPQSAKAAIFLWGLILRVRIVVYFATFSLGSGRGCFLRKEDFLLQKNVEESNAIHLLVL